MALFKKNKTTDVLSQSERDSVFFENEADSAVSIITELIRKIDVAITGIDEKVAGIDAYCAGLNDQKEKMIATKSRSEKMKAKFCALLAVD